MFYLLEIVNNARTPIDIGGPLLIRLPTGAAGASMMQGSSPHASAKGDMLTITGPFPPGKTVAQVGFSLPQAPAPTTRCGRRGRRRWRRCSSAWRRSATCRSSSPQLTDVREMNSDGQPFIMATGPRLNAGDTLVLNLTGLAGAQPDAAQRRADRGGGDRSRVGAWFALSPAKAHAAQDAKLHAQREKLMNEVVALERKRRRSRCRRRTRRACSARPRSSNA